MTRMFRDPFDDALFVSLPARRAEEQQEAFRRQGERAEKRKEKAQAERFDAADIMAVAIVTGATAVEIRFLSDRTSLHQELVIEVLQENRERLDASQEVLDDLLGRAHVLEDGRRVFETRDGSKVIDEFGNTVGANLVHPAEIDDRRPDAETYLERRNAHLALIEEQQALLEYQRELDRFEQAIEAGNLSQDEVARMEAFMTSDAPAAVRAKLPASDPAAGGPDATALGTTNPTNTAGDATPPGSSFDPSTLFK